MTNKRKHAEALIIIIDCRPTAFTKYIMHEFIKIDISYMLCDLLHVFNVIDWKTLNSNGKINFSVLTDYFAMLIQFEYIYSTVYP